MEIYLFVAFLLFYLITAFLLKDNVRKKIWMLAFIFSFLATTVSIGFVKLSQEDVMMKVGQMNWYYFLYLFGMISAVFGVFNLWIYRREMWKMIFGTDDEE